MALAILSLATIASGQTIVDAHASFGPYGEPCAGVYVFMVAPGFLVVCAGKGIVTSHPRDCVAYVHNGWGGGGGNCVAA